MNSRIKIAAGVCIAALLVIAGCGPKPIPQQSILDTPQNHYKQGLREIERGNLTDADKEFDRAIRLAPDYAGGYAGKALINCKNKDFGMAFKMIDKAIGKDKKFVDAYIIKGRILTAEKKDKDWIKNAEKSFNKALKIDPKSYKAMYYQGIAYKEAFMFNDAADSFRKVIASKGDYAQAADKEWELVQKIQRAAPGTELGKKIALIPEIDRSDLAVLLVEELKILTVIDKRKTKTYDTSFRAPEGRTEMKKKEAEQAKIADISDHWAKTWIAQVVNAGIMEKFPDNTFHPDQKITRANFAMILQNMLILIKGDNSIATKYLGSTSRFPDVNPSHFSYNAICLAVDRGFMTTKNLDGAFGIRDHVSGADALLMIRKFQNALRLTF
ncbi:S-layer homology domain-containing protein [bacterium]|nr:S-layer homology domain-containing protein [bacterium]